MKRHFKLADYDEEIKALLHEGWSLEEIADHIGVDVKRMKEWEHYSKNLELYQEDI